jgi:hypothetical protein
MHPRTGVGAFDASRWHNLKGAKAEAYHHAVQLQNNFGDTGPFALDADGGFFDSDEGTEGQPWAIGACFVAKISMVTILV